MAPPGPWEAPISGSRRACGEVAPETGGWGILSEVKPRIPLPVRLTTRPFGTADAGAAGIARGRLRGNDILHPFPAVHTTTDAENIADLCRAYAVRMPDHAFFCSVTAAAIMGVPLRQTLEQPGPLHVAVAAPHHPPEVAGVVGHRLTRSGFYTRDWHGLRLSTPELAWCESAVELSLPDLVAAGDYLIHWRLPITTAESLRAAVDSYPTRRGKPVMRRALELLDDRAESRMESHLRVVLVQGGLTGLVSNLPITTRDGINYRADFAFPDARLIIEYQGDYHRAPKQFRRDMTRVARLEAEGWYVMQVNADDLRNPGELVRRLRSVLAQRRA